MQGVLAMSRTDVLVTTEWAESNLDNPNLVFVEVDEDTTAYDAAHIADAVKLDWKIDLQDPVRRDFVNQDQFSELLSERGISHDDTVILYGGNNNWFAAYAYWYFKLYGHEKVKPLDGGRKKWELDGRPFTTETVTPETTHYKAQAPDNAIRAFRDEVLAAIGNRNLVDVRSPEEFSGKILSAGAGATPRSHPDCDERAVESGCQRGRHLQVRRGPEGHLCPFRPGRVQADHRVLPHR
jgi:thiosulfate/3-mercaptopyruvate sulfurtransferase